MCVSRSSPTTRARRTGLRPGAPGKPGAQAAISAFGHRQAVDESGAGGVQVEGDGVFEPQPLAQQPGGRGHQCVGRDGGDDDQVDVFRRKARVRTSRPATSPERPARAVLGQVGSRFANGDMAAGNARARDDPLVVRVDQLGQFVVFHFQRRKGLSTSDDRATRDVSSKYFDNQTIEVYHRVPQRSRSRRVPYMKPQSQGTPPSALMPGEDGGGKEAKERAPEAGALSWGGEESLQKACADEGA